MIQKIATTSLVTAMLLLSGCGSSDSEGESRLETQHMLDNANYDGVIAKLSGMATTAEDNLALAAAYMGRAGLSLADLITLVGDNNALDDNAFGSFIDNINDATQGSATPLSDINNATKYYTKVVGEDTCKEDNSKTITDAQKDICLFKGLTQTMGAATTMSYIADDIGSVFTTPVEGEEATPDYKLTSSTCAMQYAVDGNDSRITDCIITDTGVELTFENNNTYNSISVTVNDDASQQKYEYLLTQVSAPAIRSTAVTKGYCTQDDFTTRVDETNATTYNEATYHVCPVNEDPEADEITTGSVIADALNNGVESIGVAADESMQEDINGFKDDIKETTCTAPIDPADQERCSAENFIITEADIVNYLNDNNK